MRSTRRIFAAVLTFPLVLACGPEKSATDQAPVVTAFQEGTSPASQARRAQDEKSRADLEQCRKSREQGVYARERRFPCEAFLGE